MLASGVYTASAGNMAQGVAWGARALGIPCTVVVPDTAPATKLAAIERLGARIDKRSFDAWWRVIVEHGDPNLPGIVHPSLRRQRRDGGKWDDRARDSEDLPNVSAILVPMAVAGSRVASRAGARDVATSTARASPARSRARRPSTPRSAPAHPRRGYAPSFVDGIGSKRVADEMWPLARTLLDGAIVVPVRAVADAVRLLVERALSLPRAPARRVAAALTGPVPNDPIVCIVSGGNIDLGKLAAILQGALP